MWLLLVLVGLALGTCEKVVEFHNYTIGPVVCESETFEMRQLYSDQETTDPIAVRFPVWVKVSTVDRPWEILKEFKYLQKVRDLGISPVPVHMLMNTDDWEFGLVMQGPSNDGFLNGTEALPVKEAVSLGIQMVRILEHLHLGGIIHGNVRVENFVHAEHGELKITNYEHAVMVSERNMSSSAPWSQDIQRVRKSFKDDLFGAIVSIAALINGPGYIEKLRLKQCQKGIASNGSCKENIESVFWMDELSNPLNSDLLGEFTKSEIQDAFIAIQRSITDLDPADENAEAHGIIIRKLQYIALLLE